MKLKERWTGRLTRAALCGLLAATACPALAAADTGIGTGLVTPEPVAVPAPAPVAVPAVSAPAVTAPAIAAPTVAAPTVSPAPAAQPVPAAQPARKAATVDVAASATVRSKAGKTKVRARAKARARGAAKGSASGSFLAESVMTVPFTLPFTNTCVVPFEPVALQGFMHVVFGENGKVYTTMQGTGITMTGVKYSVISTQHAHDLGLTYTQYDRLVRAQETGLSVMGGDDFFLKSTFDGVVIDGEVECR